MNHLNLVWPAFEWWIWMTKIMLEETFGRGEVGRGLLSNDVNSLTSLFWLTCYIRVMSGIRNGCRVFLIYYNNDWSCGWCASTMNYKGLLSHIYLHHDWSFNVTCGYTWHDCWYLLCWKLLLLSPVYLASSSPFALPASVGKFRYCNCGGAGVRSTAQYYKQTSSFGAGTIGTKIFRRKGFGISCQLGLSLLRQKIDAEKMSECPSLQHFLLHFTCVITEEDSFFPGISTSYGKIRTLWFILADFCHTNRKLP